MGYQETKAMILVMAEQFNEEKREHFRYLGHGGHYTEKQIEYAFQIVREYGMRAASRILQISRRTLQRWNIKHSWMYFRRCPEWVYEWAERRRKRREFWARRGY